MKYLPFLLLIVFSSFFCHSQVISLIKPIPQSTYPWNVKGFTSCNGDLYFSNGTQLWKTNGDSTNTVMLMQSFSDVKSITCYNNKVYFVASDSVNGDELWASDGTAQGTQMVKNIMMSNGPGAYFYNTLDPEGLLTVYNNLLYFVGNDYYHGSELWQSDGTTSGTQMVVDIDPGTGVYASGVKSNLSVYNNKIFFRGGVDSLRLWTSDGTAAGTHPINSILPTGYAIFGFNGRVYLAGIQKDSLSADYGKWGLLSSDGTDTGTLLISDSIEYLTENNAVLNNKLVFMPYHSGNLHDLYITDGTPGGTSPLKKDLRLVGPNRNAYFAVYNNKVYFSASSFVGINSCQLWETDGTPQGTIEFANFTPYLNPSFLTVANGLLYFKGVDSSRVELWSTDGTLPNTKVINMPAANATYAYSSTVFGNLRAPIYHQGNHLYFQSFYDTAVGLALYKYAIMPEGIDVIESPPTTMFYPNPATGFIETTEAEVQKITVFDLTGKMLLEGSGRRIDISSLNPGVYIVLVRTKSGQKISRVLKR
ncbi:MAG TPA: T9SS type A sorting domain-containing protein [Flavipsychrobacter sp.]|nr:T9SS type A sorting domain-containing protein [Flavipsychrobacter sp.]